jgi:aminoglycoside phosphotransferase (APT) family kinase protein
MSLATELGFAWLMAHPLRGPRPQAVVHGDLGMHNILVRAGHLAAILDWELAHLGDPAEDIGNCRAALIQNLMSWHEFLDRYLAEGGTLEACDLRAVMFHSIWAHVRGSVYVALIRQMALRQEHPNLELIGVGWDFFARTQLYITRELNQAEKLL